MAGATTNSKRKHCSQMTEQEIRRLRIAVLSREYLLSEHVKDRMLKKRITVNDIISTFKDFTVVEAHNNVPNSIRVLVSGKNGCCVVVSLCTKAVVTTYWNEAHPNLDMSNYKWKVDLTEVVKR